MAIALAVLILGGVLLAQRLGGRASPTPAPPPPVEADGQVGAVVLSRWLLRHDPRNQGERLGWASGAFSGRAIEAPAVANPHPIVGAAGARNYAGSVAWYRTRFTVARAGHYAARFESVNHRATVWLDGRRLGSHVGTYLPFEMHFAANPGSHTIVIRADWRDPNRMSREGFHRTWFNYGGLNRPVTVRPLGPSELLSPVLATQLRKSGDGSRQAVVSVSVTVRNQARARTVGVEGTLSHGDQRIRLHLAPRAVRHGASSLLRGTVTVSDPALWSPGHPNLYDLSLAVPGETAYRARVGLRELRWSGGRLLVNGQPVLLRGASLQEDARNHGDALTPADQDQLVGGLKAIGANATRSQHPLDSGLLARLDAAGIMVWQGVGPVDAPGAWASNTPSLLHLAERRVLTSVRQAQLHPAIVAWNLANEVAGNGHAGGEVTYVRNMSRVLHTLDPGRMVAVDVWGDHPPRAPGPLYANVDAIGETNYMGWYEDTLAPPGTVAAKIRDRLHALQRTFPAKVLIVSEFGAEANRSNPTGRPGGYAFQARLLDLHLRTYRTTPRLSGMLVWDLRDFSVAPSFAGGSIRRTVPDIHLVKGLNQKGLYTYTGRPKPAVGVIRRAFDSLGARG